MSVLLDRDTVILEGLDLTPPCEKTVWQEHAAEVVMLCRGCRRGVMLCRRHFSRFRRGIERKLRRSLGVVCSVCKRTSATFDEAIQVVDI